MASASSDSDFEDIGNINGNKKCILSLDESDVDIGEYLSDEEDLRDCK